MSQEALAERSSLSVRGISDLERGARTFPRLETVRLLADALELAEEDRARLLAAARPELDTTPTAATEPRGAERTLRLPPLPIPPTQLIGRDAEIDRIVELFRSEQTRLITLTGQGGIGKSRLGLAIGRGFSRELGGRVAFLELAALRDPDDVPATLASQLGVAVDPGVSPAQAMAAAIGSDPMLLVIDNWEQVLDAAPVVSVLLGHCAGLWVLATSRERLRLRGEWELRLDPLSLPMADERDPEIVGQAPAVRLFVRRASEAIDGFELDAANASAVAAICRRLDGIPLAIELAAARVRWLAPPLLLERLDERFQVLTEGPRDLPERLQTMRAAIAWSVDLLDDDERRLFWRLSVFDGGFTIPMLASVLGRVDPAIGPETVEPWVVSLVEQSLLRPVDTPDGEPRFVMYETIREYGVDVAAEQPETLQIASAHAEHFLALAEASEAGLMSPDPYPTFTRLETEIANLRVAFGHLRRMAATEDAMRLGSALAWFWTEPRFLAEGQRWLRALLEMPGSREVTPAVRIRTLIAAGDLAIWQGDLDEAARCHDEALDLLRDGGDERLMASVLRSLANVALERNEFDRADRLLAEARDLARRAGHDWEVAASANLLGLSQTMQGSPAWAIDRHEEAVEIWRELGDRGHVFDALAGLGWAQLLAGRVGDSARSYQEALSIAVESDDLLQIEWCVRAAGAVAAIGGREPERATRLFSASEAMRETSGIGLRVGIGETIDQLMDGLRASLGDDRFDRGWRAGQQMTREQALGEARLVLEKAAV